MPNQLNVRDVLSTESNRERIASLLPKAYQSRIDRFISRAALTFATSKNADKLMKCKPASVVQSVCQAAEYGFALDDKFVYAIPYAGVCTAMFDYKALVAVARRHRLIIDVRAQDVREADEFEWWEEDFKQRYRFRKASGGRGEIVGAFAVVDFPNGGHRLEHMAIEELERVHKSSKSQESPAWTNWKNRMFCKAVVKRALTYVQDDPSLGSLIDYDNREYDMDKIIESPSQPKAIADLTAEIFDDETQGIEDHRPTDNGMTEEEKRRAIEREIEEAEAGRLN
ncbi:MAG: RecT family recombinase [Planctomycetota bacterium]